MTDRSRPIPIARRPEPARATRMAELATLPVFFKLGGKRALVAGGTDAAGWKAELLAAAGAKIDVYAPAPGAALETLVRESVEAVTLHRRPWTKGDFHGAAIAVGDCADAAEADAFSRAARAAGVPVNIVDRQAFSDFQFGSIVNRSPLVVGISTDGAAPVFAQAVRARIETILPVSFRRWAEAARAWRPTVQSMLLGFRARRSFWERFTRLALATPDRTPEESDREELVAAISKDTGAEVGSVALVGAGPGDPELLTLKAVRVLQSADVVLYDDLVSPHIVEMARREAERITVGKRGHKPSCTQEQISGLLIDLARAGKRVVRLKGGDPMIFGRAGEEIAALQAAAVPFEVIAGVTAATGAAASIGVSLTHRDHARRLQFVTAHARGGQLPGDLDWRALADPAATTVIYMGVKTLPALTDRLLRQGLAAATPAVLVERATQPDERVIVAPVGELAAAVTAARPTGPCIVIVGEALREIPAAFTRKAAAVSHAAE
ncbi:MAG: uroporphyrinogen-III C-methyltransferase [Methylobacteriaceae bacterium]|nr:uroporphyrinogen-III C-methyltransferase [Methylobacteriaceae bacterium]MBV9246710.1 uroporphyrinogen-III C-methyltransferase [Methylobacteriaceae bacterium]